jgi:WD40 repeat protein
MFCIYCGSPNPDDASFCGACGKAIARTGPKADGAEPVAAPERPAQPVAAAGVSAGAPTPPSVTRERVREFTHSFQILAVAFSADGGLMASAGEHAALWDAVDGRELRHFPRALEGYVSVDFSPDGRRLALAASSHPGGERAGTVVTNSLSLWDSARPDELRALTGHQGQIACVRFSPDGLLLASGGAGVHLWNVSSGRIVRSLNAGWLRSLGDTFYPSLAFSPDGQSIVTGSAYVSLWDVASGKEITKFEAAGSAAKFRTMFVGFTRDGRSIVEARGNGAIRLWDVASGRETACMGAPPNQGGDVTLIGGALSKDGFRLAVHNVSKQEPKDRGVTLWNLLTGRPEQTIATSAGEAFAFSPDSQWIAVSDTIYDGEKDVDQIKLHWISW